MYNWNMNPNHPHPNPKENHQPEPNHQPLSHPVHPPQPGDVIQPGQPLSGPASAASNTKFGPKDWMKVIIGILAIGAIIAGIVFLAGNTPGAKKNAIEKNGLQATAISDGRAFVRNDRIGKNVRKVTYKAWYTYTATDGKEYMVTGEKDYESEENVAAKKGMKASIRYAADDPYHPVFVTEE